MVDAQREIVCLAGGDLAPDAGHESRAEGSHQPEKYLGSRTMSGSNLWVAWRLGIREETISPSLD